MSGLVEILVVSYGSASAVGELLASLATTMRTTPVAIREHSADAAAVVALEQLAAGHPAPVRVEHDPTNPGFAAGCNALAAGSTARFLAFFNPDTEVVTWPWTDAAPPLTGTVIGPIVTDAPHQHFGRRYRVRDEVALSWLRRRPRPPDGAGYVSGAALLIERAAFEQIGGFDPGYFLFYEDIDLCLRANSAGIPTIVDARWTMRHGRHHSTAERFAESLIWSYESALRFHASHGSPVWAYRLYKTTDSVLRAGLHGARRTGRAGAYLALARRALSG